MPRLPTGIPGFDAMVQGGLPVGSSIVLQGPPGQEKLRFALTFLSEGLKSGGSGLVVTASQSPDAVIAELRELGVNLESVTNENRLRVVDWYSWSEETVQDIEDRGIVIRSSIDLTNLGVALSRAIAGLTGGGSRRAVIELLSPATSSYEVTQVYAFAQSAKRKFDRHQFTSLVLLEKEMHSGAQLTTLHQPFDGVIEIERTRSGDRIVRKIEVLHLKDTAPDPTFRVLEMTEAGLRVVADPAKPTEPGSVGRGRVLESQDERAQRLRLILQIATERLKLNPQDADALFAMAAAQATLDDAKGGLETLDRLAQIDSAYPGLWVLKTKLHAKLGQADLARQSRVRAIESEPEAAKAVDATVPCPMCEAPVAIDATSCANCGVKFTPTRTLEDELDDLGHAAIQEMVEEELGEEKSRAKPVDEPASPPPKSPEERRLTRPAKPTEKTPSKRGLTNGLLLGRRGAPKAGRTNGLRGRTNGLRGRTNGLTNGLGRTNGLTNGLGRTNGLTNGLGRTNGLTNGLGRTNGITNGLGRTNGLTNGLGGHRPIDFHAVGVRGAMRNAGWKLYLIPLVAVALLLLPLFFVPTFNGPAYPIQIDGQFNDWASVATEAMAMGGVLNPNVDVVRFGVTPNLGPFAFYVEVAGSALAGGGPPPGTMDTVRIFVDIDGSSATGYRIDGLGADRLLEVSGHNGTVLSSTLWEFDSNRNQRDWNGWIKGTATPAAASGSRIETEAQWLAGVSPSVPIIATVHTVSWDEQTDTGDFPVSPGLGTLSAVADPQTPDVIAGSGVALLRLSLTAHGQPVTLDSVHVEVAGTAPANASSRLQLTDGTNVLAQVAPTSRDVTFSFAPMQLALGSSTNLTVLGDFASASGETFGVRLPAVHPFGLGAGVVSLRENPGARMLGYLGSVPSTPRVDGAFDEWNALSSDTTNDVAPRSNPDIDLGRYGAQRNGTSTFLYADVTGRLFHGTPVPEHPQPVPVQSQGPADTDRDGVPDAADPFPFDFNNDGVPDAQTNGDYDRDGITDYGFPGGTDYWLNTTIPSTFPAPYAGRSVSVYIGPDNRPPVLGDDVIRIFLDIDNSTFSGYSIGGIGADRLVEIRGKDGAVTQSALLAFTGSFPGQWDWTPLSPVTVALGYHAVELSVGLNASNLYVESGDFWGSVDSTTVVSAFALLTSSFKVSSANAPLAVPWQQAGPQSTSTLVDPNSNAVTTGYNQQRKIVRAGAGAGATPCDAANSAGCWYTVFYDQLVETTASSAPSTETITTGSRPSGTFPGDIQTSNNVYIDYAEGINPAIAFVNDGSSTAPDFWNNVDQNSYPTLSWTPPASGLIVLFVASEVTSGTANQPTVSGNSITWTAIKTIPVGLNRLTLFGADASGSSAGTTTIDFGVQSQDGCEASFFHASNIDLSGGVAAAFVQSPTGSGTGLSSSIPLASPGNPANRPVSGWFRAGNGGTNPRANWAEIDDGNHNQPNAGMESQWRSDAFETTASASWSGSSVAWLGIAAELKRATNYQMEVRYDWSGIASGSPSYALKVEAHHTVSEDFLVQVLTPPSTWTTRITITKTADDNTAQAYTLTTAEFNSGAPAVRFIGATESGDTIQSDLYLDYVTVSSNSVWDRVVLMRSRDTSGSTWSGQIVLASGRSGDSALVLARDSAEPSIAIDSAGFLHVVWVSASGSGDQSTLNLVRYTKTTVAYPTETQLANAANWQAVTNVDDTNPGFMPTVSTDSSNNPHIAWSQSKTFGEEAWISYRSNTGTNTVNSPKSRTWDGTSWSAPETEESTAGSPLRNVRMAYSPIARDERIVVTVSDDGWLDAYVCTPTCTVTNNLGQVWSTPPSVADYRFDIAYEELSGRALLVYGVLSTDTTHDIAYREYTGSWGPEQYLDNTNNATDLQYAQIELAPKAGSDQVGLMAETTNGVVTAWIWSGTAFGSFAEVTATGYASSDGDRMAIAWEANSGHLLAVTAAGPLGETIVYREFTTSWSSSSTYPCGTSGKNDQWLSLKPNPVPTTDEMILLIGQSGAPTFVSTCYWSGSGWSNFVTHDAAIDSWTTRSEDFAWESTGSKGLLVWGTTGGQITYRTFTAPNTWGTITNVAMGTVVHYWVALRTNPFPQPGRPRILGAVLDVSDNLGAITWDGSAFTVVGANSFTADTGSHTFENFDLQYHPAPGSVYYKNRAGGTWRPTVVWGTTYTGLSVDVSPQNNYVALAGYFDNTAEQAAIAYRSNTGSNTINSPKTRTWDGSTWSAEVEQANANNPIRVVRMAWSPTDANTRIIVTESDDGWLDAYVCAPTCAVTNNIGQVWSTAPTTAQARFDIAYEQVSGKAILAYHKEGGSGTQDIAYKTYSGGTWSGEQYIDDPGSAATHYVYSVIKLASRRGSNQIGLIGGDLTNTHVNAWVWDGSTWGNFVAITTSAGPVTTDNADIAWESSSGRLLAVAATNGVNIVSKEFTNAWGSAVTFQCISSGATMQYTRLKANPLPTADDMVVAVVDSSYALNTCYWTGSSWANRNTQDTAIDQFLYRAFDFAWEATGSNGLLVWSTTAGQITYRAFTAPNTWGTITNVAMGATDHTWIQVRTNPSPQAGATKILGAASENSAQSLGGIRWDGTTLSVIGTSTFTANTGGFMDNEMFDLKYPQVRAGGTGEIREMVCRNLAVSNCTTSSNFTKWDGTPGVDTVAMGVVSGTYPSLATTWDASGDSWVAYEKDVNGTTRGVYARFLDYPTAGWQAPETIDSLAGTVFTRPSIGIDKNNAVHALYVATSGPQLYYEMRSSGVWGSRIAVDTSSDSPSLMVRAPNDATYGSASGAVYWKPSTSETYFYYIPEFETVIAPILGTLGLVLMFGRRTRSKRRKSLAASV